MQCTNTQLYLILKKPNLLFVWTEFKYVFQVWHMFAQSVWASLEDKTAWQLRDELSRNFDEYMGV